MITPYYLFETERLAVRQYTLQDEEHFYQFSGNEEVMRYIRPIVTKEESDKLLAQNIQSYLSNPNTGRWAVIEKATGKYIGSFSILSMESDNSRLHIGYALLPQYWGQGYATELLRNGLIFFFNHHTNSIVYGITEEANTASQKVLIKCGFSHYSRLQEHGKEIVIFVLNKTGEAGNGEHTGN